LNENFEHDLVERVLVQRQQVAFARLVDHFSHEFVVNALKAAPHFRVAQRGEQADYLYEHFSLV
jgi:hypothetical protein